MTPWYLRRIGPLAPVGWLLVALLALFVLGSVGRSLGIRWDPFNLQGRKLANAEADRDFATADASARGLEVEGGEEQAARVEAAADRAARAAISAAETIANARSAPDANEPLEAGRAARLLASDRELCRISPATCAAGTAASDPADDGGG